MEFRACCCLKPRTGALVAGIVDLVVGVVGIVAIIYLQLGHRDHGGDQPTHLSAQLENGSATVVTEVLPPEPTAAAPNASSSNLIVSSQEDYPFLQDWDVAVYLYAFSAVCTLAHGIIILIAVGKKNSFLASTGLAVNAVRILGCVAGTVGVFIMGYHWALLMPMLPAVALQLYFFWVIFDYQKYFSYSQPLNVKPRA